MYVYIYIYYFIIIIINYYYIALSSMFFSSCSLISSALLSRVKQPVASSHKFSSETLSFSIRSRFNSASLHTRHVLFGVYHMHAEKWIEKFHASQRLID